MIVELIQTGRSIRGLSKELGISEATNYKWENLYVPNQSTRLTEKETAELRKEHARLKEELEIKKNFRRILSLCCLLEIPRNVYYFHKNKPLTATK